MYTTNVTTIKPDMPLSPRGLVLDALGPNRAGSILSGDKNNMGI